MIKKLSNEDLNRINIDDYKLSTKAPIVVVLDNIRSMHNIGSVFRTADAFRIEAVLLCGITATPPNKEIQKTALGATESVDWKYYDSTVQAIQELKKQGYLICAIEQTSKSTMLNNFKPDFKQKLVFVFGNEVNGVSEEVIKEADFYLEIPQFGTKHSLNVSVSVGIVIWDTFLKLNI